MLIGAEGKKGDWAIKERVRFGVIAAMTFFAMGGAMYAL
jgi:hypothetical protein